MNFENQRGSDLALRFACRMLLALAAIAVAIQWAGNAQADSITFQSGVSPTDLYRTQDAHVRNDAANLNKADNNTRIVIGSLAAPNVGALRGLYSYPLTGVDQGIPAGATITSVEFRVVQIEADTPASQDGDIAVELRTISQSFSQGMGVVDPAGGATWNNTFGDTMTLGATVLSTALMNPEPPVIPLPTDPLTWVHTTFPTSASLVAAVQTQLDAGQPFNFALVFPSSEETSGVRKIIRTASNTELTTTVDNRPRLIIEYTAPAGLPGDYNGDDIVDAADYTVWRNNLGGDASVFAPGSRSTEIAGVVGPDDYDFWKGHYGDTSPGSAAGQGGLAVPEPCAAMLVVFGAILPACLLRRNRCRLA